MLCEYLDGDAVLLDLTGETYFTLKGTSQMIKSRRYHGCGILRRSDKHNGRPLLVVAGSMKGSAPDGGGGNNCEFYDYTRQGSQWELCSKSNS